MNAPDRPTREQVEAARIRIVADGIRKAIAYRMGVSRLSPLEDAADLPWLEGAARNVLTALASADTDAALVARTPQPTEPDWVDDGVEHWETAGFWVERDATGRDGPTWRLNGDVVSRWVVERFRDALNAALALPGHPLPAVPAGDDAASVTLRQSTLMEAFQTVETLLGYRIPCGFVGDLLTRCATHEHADAIRAAFAPLHAAPSGEDVPARLDAAAEALEALHSHGLGYELRQVADQLRDGDGGTPELRAAVAAALALPTETQK